MMDFRNAEYLSDGRIKAEVDHPRFGWIPHTASPDDPATSELFATMDASGAVAAYVAPPEPTAEELLEAARQAAAVDRVVFLLGLFNMGKITTEIADEASDGSWPSAWNADIAGLSLEGRMEIKAAWKSADTVAYYGMFLQKIAFLAQTATAPITVTQAELDTVFGVSA